MTELDSAERARLYLVTPPSFVLDTFKAQMESALQGGDVAAVLIAAEDPNLVMEAAQSLSPMIQDAGAASLVFDESRAVGRSNADGIHLEGSLPDLEAALDRMRPNHIVGMGGLSDRHTAMQAGELGPDYVFFGSLGTKTDQAGHARDLDLASWWSGIFEIPAVVLAADDLENVQLALETGAEFIAVRSAVWSYNEGPAAAVARINRLLDDDAI